MLNIIFAFLLATCFIIDGFIMRKLRKENEFLRNSIKELIELEKRK